MVTDFIAAQTTFQRLYNFSQKQQGFQVAEVAFNQYLFLNYIADCGLCPHTVELLKVNQFGDTIITASFNYGYQTAADYFVQSGNSFIIPIISNPGGNNTVTTTLMVDSNLIEVWHNTFTDSILNFAGTRVIQTSDSGFIVSGMVRQWSNDPWNLFILKLDPNGNTLWHKIFNFNATVFIYSIMESENSSLLFTGSISGSPGSSNILIFKTDSLGDSLTTKTYVLNSFSEALFNSKWHNKYILGGYSSDTTITNSDGFILFLDSNLDSTSSYIFDIGLKEIIYSFTSDSSEFIVTGTAFNSSLTIGDVFFQRFDTNNTLVNTKIISGPGNERYTTSISKTSDGGLIIGATSYNTFGYPSALLMKTDNNGDIVGVPEIEGSVLEIIYPNPSTGKFYISGKCKVKKGTVFSIVGERILEFTESDFDLSGYEEGIYLYDIIFYDGSSQKGKLIKVN
jgi:hypothetical protein